MEYSTLGRTGIQVSKICLGTMTFGEQNSEAEGHEQMDYAVSQGVNFFDTAEMYSVPGRPETQGSTERILGTWFKKRGKRDDIILATKVTGPSAGLKHIRNPLKFNREQIRAAITGSLGRLQTDYVDLYQLHWPERKTNYFGQRGYRHDPEDGWEDNLLSVLEVMQELVEEGKIRHFGVSNETPWGLMRFLQLAEQHGLPRCASIQNPYSLLNRTFETGLAEVAIRENAGLLAYSPMAFGLLSGKYHLGKDSSRDRINKYRQLSRYNSEQSKQATARYLELAQAHGLSLAQMSLAFVNTRPFMTANIIGATTMEQLKENIGSIEVALSEEVRNEIEAIHDLIPNPAP
ncbi:NADP(H)-dependent aldo-keto reductase [Phaeodactylibacter luteus]|uniref:Protein tas n=1 Tax=Phaeodactylibacter luteus TaxID=1564516 RepID=A0A5C6S0T5_9BACT|nr:NADP(H)-dependent aldo-keto reductase [Phaeodactylibacter luteus]TXB67609.1 NADP(H)-dependent aldo-keto reductase [Phaeodactylibacter luteus]